MKLFITGATGFIGKRLLERCSSDDEIYILCRKDPGKLSKNITVLSGNLENHDDLYNQLTHICPDVCIHLAWEGIPDYGFFQSLRNLDQGSALLQHLVEKCGCRKIIATGSCWEYGKTFGSCREEEHCTGGNYFTWAKRALCDFGMMLASGYPVAFIWTRLFYVYGPGQRTGALLPTITDAFLAGNVPEIRTPLNASDFIYVDDVADALLQLGRFPVKTGIYNIGSGVSTPVWQICDIVEHALGREAVYASMMQRREKIPATADFCADMTKTASVIKWHAHTTIEEGIKQYLSSVGAVK